MAKTGARPRKAASPTASNGARGLATKARIEEAALDLFYRQGFRTTTMREITSACDLTPAAFYNHFAAKEDLLLSLIEQTFERLEATMNAAVEDTDETSRAQLIALVRAMTLWHCDNSRIARIANREAIELGREQLQAVNHRRRRLRGMIEQTIVEGGEAGEFDLPGTHQAVARVLATSVLDLVRAIPDGRQPNLTPESLADLFSTLVLRMVGAPPK